MTAWKRYLAPGGEWAFINERLRLPDERTMGEALERDPWQREIWEVLLDAQVRLAFIDAIRGLGKTTLAAAFAVMTLTLRRGVDVFVLANDRDQAKILFREAKGFIDRDPHLRQLCETYRHEIRNTRNGSTAFVLSSDSVGNFGFGSRPFLAIFDELWGAQNRDLFDALWSAIPKSPGSMVAALTNAGPDRAGPAWDIREMCRASTDPALRLWAASERGVKRPSWISAEEVDRQRRTLPPSVYARLWLGEWGHGSGDFLTREDVEVCIDERLDPRALQFDPSRRYYIGIDLGLKHDRSVVAVVHKERETVIVDHLATWEGTVERPVSLEDVQAYLGMLGRKIPRLRRGFLDPWQGAMLLERARRSGLPNLEEYTFTPANLQKLSQAVWNVFRSRNIRIPGHARLVDELVTARIVEKRYGWRVDHQAGGFSDHLMAVGLAIVAAIPDAGDLVAESSGDTGLIARLRAKVRNQRRFGFRKPAGLRLVSSHAQPENWYAAGRLTQLLIDSDRLSIQEARVIRQELREEFERDAGPFGASAMMMATDALDRRFGRISDFYLGDSESPITQGDER